MLPTGIKLWPLGHRGDTLTSNSSILSNRTIVNDELEAVFKEQSWFNQGTIPKFSRGSKENDGKPCHSCWSDWYLIRIYSENKFRDYLYTTVISATTTFVCGSSFPIYLVMIHWRSLMQEPLFGQAFSIYLFCLTSCPHISAPSFAQHLLLFILIFWPLMKEPYLYTIIQWLVISLLILLLSGK
jgi:hypothetical protein